MGERDESHRPFPIQAGKPYRKPGRFGMIYPKKSTIPWWLAQRAYDGYVAKFGDSQSLERLASRGGFGRNELLYLLGCVDEDEL